MNETFEAIAKSYLDEYEEEIKARIFEYMDEHKDVFKDEILSTYQDEILSSYKEEILLTDKIEMATNFLKNTSLSIEDIALNIGLPVEEVESLKAKISDS